MGVIRQVVGTNCIVTFESCGIKPLKGMYREWELERYMKNMKNTDIFNMGSFIFLFLKPAVWDMYVCTQM